MKNRNCRRIHRILKKLIRQGEDRFIIYPYGEYGKYTEECLLRYEIKPIAILDNKVEAENVYKADYLDTEESKNCVMLLATAKTEPIKEVIPYIRKNNRFIFWKDIMKAPRHRTSFLLNRVKNKMTTRLLDIGCGNQSARFVKEVCPNIDYIGLDVGDYNQTEESLKTMDEYLVVAPEDFADTIEKIKNIDAVISYHNLEHCNEPEKVLIAITKCLKKGGYLFMGFPSEASVNFPSRGGTLNFYDDSTHQYLPKYNEVIISLKENGMKIVFAKKQYKPFLLNKIGKRNEKESIKKNHTMEGTWAYWGFETIIWAKKR